MFQLFFQIIVFCIGIVYPHCEKGRSSFTRFLGDLDRYPKRNKLPRLETFPTVQMHNGPRTWGCMGMNKIQRGRLGCYTNTLPFLKFRSDIFQTVIMTEFEEICSDEKIGALNFFKLDGNQ